MEKSTRKKSAGLKESNKISKPKPEEQFIGFDVDDDVLLLIENKKKCVKRALCIETGEPMEVDDESSNSPTIFINNHVTKKKRSIPSMSSPEPTDVKNNRSNKKQKKDKLPSDTLESSELDVPTLELTTPTFNLTSSNIKSRRSTGRKKDVDITDPIFKLPFEQGWKRELVYRSSGESTIINRANRSGDVYYYSPNNRKLRSLREIQEQLDISTEGTLTLDSFTFLKQPIGMNDRTKELIRDANSKVSKEDSFVGVAVRPKKSKTPVQRPQFDYELSDDENNKSSSKMKIVFKNSKRSRSRSKKEKSNSEEMTSSTPEYISEDWQAIQSNVSPKDDFSDINSTIIKRRLSTSDGEVIMQTPCGIRCPNNDEPATLMCAQCLVYYHPACVNLNANLKIVGYVCINCRSTVRQRNRRVQSSHTVVVGATEHEPLRVEPIRIRQVQQASDTPNFFIDKTPISKNEEPHYEIDDPHFEIDELSDEESDSDIINTVICQGNVCKTAMIDGNFHEQYVYEMKQTRGPSLMTCVIQEPKHLDEDSEMNGSVKEIATPFSSMQSFNYMAKALRHVFKYLKTHELLSASRVCTAWHIIAMNKSLWQNVRLKNSMVYDWEKFVDSIDEQSTTTLDTRRMLIPPVVEDFEKFWLNFDKALKRAKKLKTIELYRCPAHVVEDAIYSLPQLAVLNATSIKNPNVSKDVKNPNDLMILDLTYLGQMTNLTELRLKGLSGIKLSTLPSFENLINLKTLSLTCIKSFPKDIGDSLGTLSTNLEILEIGDADCLTKDFAVSLKKFENLTSLRFENCCGGWENIVLDVFCAIRGLKKLRILELINIEFSNNVEDELEKCDGIKGLLIIPAYVSQSATTNCHLIDCLKKLTKSLTHLVWGLTHELLRVTDLFITQYQQNQHTIGYNLELSHTKETTNNIPILRIRKPRQRDGDESEKDKVYQDKSDNVDILSVPALEKLLDTMMPNTKSRVLKVPFSSTTRVYLTEQFPELNQF